MTAHTFRLQRTRPGQPSEAFVGHDAHAVLWQDDISALTAACTCGWTNPSTGEEGPAAPLVPSAITVHAQGP